jgi:hypothetical protein
MAKGTVSNGPSLTLCRFPLTIVLGMAICPSQALHAQDLVDVVAYFQRIQNTRGEGLAHKTKPVDVRPAKPGEVIVTSIKGEGKETQSPSAKPGDMVVWNRCPETGNEQILVPAASFSQRYERPIGAGAVDGWLIVAEQDGAFTFIAPWNERMVARPGDSIVQDPNNPKDTYRVAKAAFACTYDILSEPRR